MRLATLARLTAAKALLLGATSALAATDIDCPLNRLDPALRARLEPIAVLQFVERKPSTIPADIEVIDSFLRTVDACAGTHRWGVEAVDAAIMYSIQTLTLDGMREPLNRGGIRIDLVENYVLSHPDALAFGRIPTTDERTALFAGLRAAGVSMLDDDDQTMILEVVALCALRQRAIRDFAAAA